MSLGFGFGFPKRVSSGGSGAFSQLGPTLDLVFAGQPTTGDPSQLYSLDMNYLAQTYSVGAMYTVWAGGQMVPANFQDIITFQRTSPGWYYNSSGYLTQSGINNYLTYSNQFDNAAWTKSNSFVQTNIWLWSQDFDNANWGQTLLTVDPNKVTAPDGTQTADILTATASTGVHLISQSTAGLTGTPITMSVYAKAGTNSFLQVFHGALAINYANFNIATGTVGDVGAGFTSATMTPAGNGWYRCVVVMTPTAASNFRIVIASSATAPYNDSWTTTGTESVYLWGAQCVQGSVPGDYRATTSAALPVLYTGPTGLVDARKLCEDATAATTHRTSQSTTVGTEQVLSVYAKAGERTQIALQLGNNAVFFNLATGSIISGFGAGAAIQAIGDGWYRCSYATIPTTTSCIIFIADSSSANYNGNGSSGIYISDAQLELGSAATSYWPTTNSVYYAPRFDYDPATLQPKGLLIEEQRVNYMIRSSEFDASSWQNSAPNIPTITANAAIAPDGTVTADLLTAATGGVNSQARQVASTGTTGNFTGSFFLKAGSSARSRIILVDATTTFTVVGDFQVAWAAGVASVFSTASGTASVVSAGNGWYRCIITANVPSAAATASIAVFPDALAGTGTVYAWGAQLEAGAFATSYIPTTTTAVPRASDLVSVNSLSPWYNTLAGTWAANFQTTWSGTADTSRWILGADDSSSKRMMYIGSTSSVVTTFDGTTGVSTSGAITGIATKAASTYTSTARSIVANGGTVASGAVVAGYPATSYINVGRTGPAAQLCGWISRVTYYPRALSNTELQTVTA